MHVIGKVDWIYAFKHSVDYTTRTRTSHAVAILELKEGLCGKALKLYANTNTLKFTQVHFTSGIATHPYLALIPKWGLCEESQNQLN